MARTQTSETVSPYYPPRQRWYGRFSYWGIAARRLLAMNHIHLPEQTTLGGMMLGILVPGLAVYLRGPREWGRVAMITWAVLFLMFTIWLGYPAANLAFGLMVSLHATGFIYYCSPILHAWQYRTRFLFTVLVLMSIGLLIYLPVRGLVQNHLLMPLRNGNQVVIVCAQRGPVSLELGEWAAFAYDNGIIFGKIIGLGGDEVNSTKVPKNYWLISVQFVRRYYYHHDLFRMYTGRSEVFEQNIVVSPEGFVGKPFKHWFWRKQILP